MSTLKEKQIERFLGIGASDTEDNVYAIDAVGAVHWYGRGEVESFVSFEEFMGALIAHNAELLAEVTRRDWKL